MGFSSNSEDNSRGINEFEIKVFSNEGSDFLIYPQINLVQAPIQFMKKKDFHMSDKYVHKTKHKLRMKMER
jgi:hypothetical protein